MKDNFLYASDKEIVKRIDTDEGYTKVGFTQKNFFVKDECIDFMNAELKKIIDKYRD